MKILSENDPPGDGNQLINFTSPKMTKLTMGIKPCGNIVGLINKKDLEYASSQQNGTQSDGPNFFARDLAFTSSAY